MKKNKLDLKKLTVAKLSNPIAIKGGVTIIGPTTTGDRPTEVRTKCNCCTDCDCPPDN
ncbi:hypothetical protein [Aquimarina amphilecti]|nr:hypothetical protein [Aquimarina amphilecti]